MRLISGIFQKHPRLHVFIKHAILNCIVCSFVWLRCSTLIRQLDRQTHLDEVCHTSFRMDQAFPPLDILASSPLVSAHRQSLPEPPLSHAKTKTDDCRTSKSDCSLSKVQFWQCSNHSTCRSCRKLQNTPWHGKIRCAHRRIHVKHPEMLTAQMFHPVHTSLELSSPPKSIWAVFETQHNLKSPKHRLTQCYAVCTRNWQPGMLTAQLSSLKSLVSTSFHGPKFSKASYGFCPTKL